jgi:hypothetical protein
MGYLLNLWRRVKPTAPIGGKLMELKTVTTESTVLSVRDIMDAIIFYVKVKFSRMNLFELFGHDHPGGFAPDFLEASANCLPAHTEFFGRLGLVHSLVVN